MCWLGYGWISFVLSGVYVVFFVGLRYAYLFANGVLFLFSLGYFMLRLCLCYGHDDVMCCLLVFACVCLCLSVFVCFVF